MNSGSSQHTPVYRQPESFLQKPAISQSNKANPKTVVAVVLIIIISVLGIFIYRIGKLNAHKQFDFGDFTIELPSKMKEVEDSKFVSLLNAHSYKASEYEADCVRFAYIIYDYSDAASSSDQKITSRSLIDSFAEAYSSYPDYYEYEKSSNVLKMRMRGDDDILAYCHIKIVKDNDRVFILYLVCNDSYKSGYEKRFDEYMSSFYIK